MSPGRAGRFVCVVGPSGAGKDTLIAEARRTLGDDPAFFFVRRLVTRPVNAYEDHDSLSQAEFAAGVEQNTFALHWRAHGLGYAVPTAARAAVHRGAVAVCNVSRAVIADARTAFPATAVALITASQDVIARRLAGRGRETLEAVSARLDREAALNAAVVPDCTIVNDGSREAGGEQLVQFLQMLQVEAFSNAGERHPTVIPAKAGTQ